MKLYAKILGIALLGLGLNACGTTSPSSMASDAPDTVLTKWWEIHHALQSASGRTTKHVGYLSKVSKKSGFTYTVRDVKNEPVGFMLEDTQTFRFVKKYDVVTGKSYQNSEYIGNFGVERAVLRILGITEGESELRELARRDDDANSISIAQPSDAMEADAGEPSTE